MSKQFLSLEALALNLGLPQNYIRNLAKSGDIPYLNVNGRMRFDEESVRQHLHNLTNKSLSPQGGSRAR